MYKAALVFARKRIRDDSGKSLFFKASVWWWAYKESARVSLRNVGKMTQYRHLLAYDNHAVVVVVINQHQVQSSCRAQRWEIVETLTDTNWELSRMP